MGADWEILKLLLLLTPLIYNPCRLSKICVRDDGNLPWVQPEHPRA